MLKFFRKIRQNLLTENKFSKYLIYAIGEIILVVIGILIALAINNANQKSILKEKEHTYLIGLKEEFEISKKKLTELMQVNQNSYNSAKQILSYTSNLNNRPTEKELSELLLNTLSFDVAFNPNNSLLSEMINSGSLKDISNDALRIHLANWVATLEDIAKQENDLANQREKVIEFFRSDNYSLRTVFDLTAVSNDIDLPKQKDQISNSDLLNSNAFENNLLMFILSSHATEEAHYQPLMEDINRILELIDSEIP